MSHTSIRRLSRCGSPIRPNQFLENLIRACLGGSTAHTALSAIRFAFLARVFRPISKKVFSNSWTGFSRNASSQERGEIRGSQVRKGEISK
jgi:hypothetical protein